MTTLNHACPAHGTAPGQPCPTPACPARYLAARTAAQVAALRDVAVPIDPTPSRYPWRR